MLQPTLHKSTCNMPIQLFTGAPQLLKINFSTITRPFLNRFQCSIYQSDGLSTTQRVVQKATSDKSIQLCTGASKRLKTRLLTVIQSICNRFQRAICQNDGRAMLQLAGNKLTCGMSIQLFTGASKRLKTQLLPFRSPHVSR
jgi:hypothetical protein